MFDLSINGRSEGLNGVLFPVILGFDISQGTNLDVGRKVGVVSNQITVSAANLWAYSREFGSMRLTVAPMTLFKFNTHLLK